MIRNRSTYRRSEDRELMFSHVDKQAIHRRRELIKSINEKAEKRWSKTYWAIRKRFLF